MNLSEEAQTVPALACGCNRPAAARGPACAELVLLPGQLAGPPSTQSSCQPAMEMDLVFGPMDRSAMRDDVIGA